MRPEHQAKKLKCVCQLRLRGGDQEGAWEHWRGKLTLMVVIMLKYYMPNTQSINNF